MLQHRMMQREKTGKKSTCIIYNMIMLSEDFRAFLWRLAEVFSRSSPSFKSYGMWWVPIALAG